MKILYLRTNGVNPDPRVEKEVNALIEDGHEVTILAWDRESSKKITISKFAIQNGEAIIYRLGYKSSWGGGMKRNLTPFIRYFFTNLVLMFKLRKKYQVIHAVDLLTYIPALIFKLIFRKKVVYDIFDFYADSQKKVNVFTKFLSYLEKKLIKHAEFVILCAEYRLGQIYPSKPRKVVFIHNSPSENQLNNVINPYELNKNALKLCYVGNLINERFILELISALKNTNKYELHIGGVGVLQDSIRELAKVHNNIKFYGKLEYSNVLNLEKSCDYLVAFYDPKIRNHKYSAPNKLYEAMFLGKPILALRGTGFDAIVEKENLGIVIDSVSTVDILDGLNKLEQAKSSGSITSEHLISTYHSKYNWSIMKERLQAAYKVL